MALGNYEDAKALFDQALVVDPNYKQAYLGKGLALHADGKLVEAQQEYDKALEIDPGYFSAKISKMHDLLALNKPREAFGMLI